MVQGVLSREARKPAPSCEKSSRSKPVVVGELSIAERADSAIAARGYGSKPASAFDRGHRAAFVAVHARFRRRYRRAYGRVYPRSIHTDWRALRELIREVGAEWAEVVVERVFDEPLMVGAGVESMQLVVAWWPAMVRHRRKASDSRLSREEQALMRTVIREHAAMELA